jgi:hypothetical protein
MEAAERVAVAGVSLVVLPQLQDHQLAGGIQNVAGIERAALGLAAGAGLLEEGFVAEEANALFDRHVLAVEPDADNQAAEANERLRQLAEADGVVALPESFLHHHLLAVVRPPFDERR